MSYIPQVSPDRKTLRTGAIATSFDASGTALRMQKWNQAVFYFTVVIGSATDIRVQFDLAAPDSLPGVTGNAEPAFNSTDWAPYFDERATTTAGVLTVAPLELKFTADGTHAVKLDRLCAMWLRPRAKVTGSTTNATLTIKATTGMA